MIQTTVKVSGMACSMCEAHINDTIRTAFPWRRFPPLPFQGGDGDPLSRAAGRKRWDAATTAEIFT